MDKQKLIDFYKVNSGGINGAVIGLLISVFVLFLGLFKTLFVALCVGFGYYIGKKISTDKEYIRNLLDKILPPGTYR